MKKITTTILILFVCFSGYGQSGTTGEVKNPIGFSIAGNTITTSGTLTIVKLDTIRVLLLTCDTITGYLPAIIDLNTTSSKQHVHEVYWQYGYSVEDFRGIREYLDADKKPLKKSTIVFLTKEIK